MSIKKLTRIDEHISNLVLSLSSSFRRIPCPFASILFILAEFFARIRSWRACLLHARFSSPETRSPNFEVSRRQICGSTQNLRNSLVLSPTAHTDTQTDTHTHPRNASLRGYFDFVINLPHQPETSILQGKLATPAASTCTIQFGSRILSW